MNVQTSNIGIELSGVIVSVNQFKTPEVLVISGDLREISLPSGGFDPINHKTLEIGLRNWIVEQTPFKPEYVEQLYTFGNQGRVAIKGEDVSRVVSVGYLALTWRQDKDNISKSARWDDWYSFFPWEDWREGRPKIIDENIIPALNKWTDSIDSLIEKKSQIERIKVCFTKDESKWDYEQVLERYELLYEARLIGEVFVDKNIELPDEANLIAGSMMKYDHRRILATAIGRLRGKIKYRPVIFELMPDSFTLLQLQRTIEAIGGYKLHKQNFRRMLENNKLVEETGEISTKTGGRPAALFSFRRDVLLERIAIGVKMSPTS